MQLRLDNFGQQNVGNPEAFQGASENGCPVFCIGQFLPSTFPAELHPRHLPFGNSIARRRPRRRSTATTRTPISTRDFIVENTSVKTCGSKQVKLSTRNADIALDSATLRDSRLDLAHTRHG
jgi:hypothetical protein